MFEFLSNKITTLFGALTGRTTLTEDRAAAIVEEVTAALYDADVPHELVVAFRADLGKRLAGSKRPQGVSWADVVTHALYETVYGYLAAAPAPEKLPRYATMLVCGLQGSGKTTTVVKLAHWYREGGEAKGKKSVLVASVDYDRPAAREQLAIAAKTANIPCYHAKADNPVDAVREIVAEAKRQQVERLFIDTAGRMHVDEGLLKQLQELVALAKPQQTLLVLDSMTGQESLAVARTFNATVQIHGVVFTKMDSKTRGGAVLGCAYSIAKPVLFVGVGEKYDDLEKFHPRRIAQQIVGLGDLETLAEKVELAAAQSGVAKNNSKKIEEFSFEDYAQAIAMMKGMGPLGRVMSMLPGMKVSDADMRKMEQVTKVHAALIGSMTPKERLNPSILSKSRCARIVRGAGAQPGDMEQLLKGFEEMRRSAKLFMKMAPQNNKGRHIRT